jgi:hypothetical protein
MMVYKMKIYKKMALSCWTPPRQAPHTLLGRAACIEACQAVDKMLGSQNENPV